MSYKHTHNYQSQFNELTKRTLWKKEQEIKDGEYDDNFYNEFKYCQRKHNMPTVIKHQQFLTSYRWTTLGKKSLICKGFYLPDYQTKFISISYRDKNNKRRELDSDGVIRMFRNIMIGRNDEPDDIGDIDW